MHTIKTINIAQPSEIGATSKSCFAPLSIPDDVTKFNVLLSNVTTDFLKYFFFQSYELPWGYSQIYSDDFSTRSPLILTQITIRHLCLSLLKKCPFFIKTSLLVMNCAPDTVGNISSSPIHA